MLKKDTSFEEYAQLEEYASQDDIARIRSELLACPDINNSLCGTIIEMSKNHAKSVLFTSADMVVDEQGLIFDAYIFSAANYVAQAAINKEFAVLIGSRCFFYAPLRLGDVLELEAQALFDDTSKKRDVRIVGHVKDIKMFEATLQLITTDEHIFKLKRPLTATKVEEEKATGDDEAAIAAMSAMGPEAMASVLASMSK